MPGIESHVHRYKGTCCTMIAPKAVSIIIPMQTLSTKFRCNSSSFLLFTFFFLVISTLFSFTQYTVRIYSSVPV